MLGSEQNWQTRGLEKYLRRPPPPDRPGLLVLLSFDIFNYSFWSSMGQSIPEDPINGFRLEREFILFFRQLIRFERIILLALVALGGPVLLIPQHDHLPGNDFD